MRRRGLFRPWLSLLLCLGLLAAPAAAETAEDQSREVLLPRGIQIDDCVDFSAVYDHSEGIYPEETAEENRYAFDDYTMFKRRESTAEWVEYRIPEGRYLIFHTYFRQNEAISHFRFSWSAQGDSWQDAEPSSVQVLDVPEWQWIPVFYTLRNLDPEAKYLRITFDNLEGEAWSPGIAGVYTQYIVQDDPGFADCIGTPYYQASALLKNLGFVTGRNEYEFGPQDLITRAEFAKLAAGILGLSSTDRGARIFRDLPQDHWASGAVAGLYALGVVHGDEQGDFHPDDPVLCQEAVKMLVCALGRTAAAEDQGGYPDGYWRLGSRLGILNGNAFAPETQLNRGMAALLFVNALDAEVLYQTSFGGETHTFAQDGSTLLNYYHDIYKVNGVLTDAGAASITGAEVGAPGTAAIDGQVFGTGSFPLRPLLGQRISAYVQYSGQDARGKILYALAEPGQQITDLTPARYLGLDQSTVLYESESGKLLRAGCTNNTRVVRNGRHLTRIGLAESLDFSCGTMRLIRYSGSPGIDVILIDDYKTYILAAASRLGGVLTDREQGAVRLNLDQAQEISLSYYGETRNYSPDLPLARDDIVCAAVSQDGQTAKLWVSGSRITGALAGIFGEELTVGDRVIQRSAALADTDLSELLGREVVVYPDVNGAAAAVVSAEPRSQYGYLQSTAARGGFGSQVSLRLISREDGVTVRLADAETRLNGFRGRTEQIAALQPQLVRFALRDDGRVLWLETAEQTWGQVGLPGFSENLHLDSGKYYGDGMKLFSSIYQLDQQTQVFWIPADRDDIEKYAVRDVGSLITDKRYRVTLYDVNDQYVAAAAVIDTNGSEPRQLENFDPVAVVESAAHILDGQGRPSLCVYARVNGQETQVYFDSEGGTDDTNGWVPGYTRRDTAQGNNPFHPGEVFQYYSDDAGHCRNFRMLFTRDMTEKDAWYERHLGDYGILDEQSYFSELYSFYGTVTQKLPGKVIAAAGPDGYPRTFSLTGADILRFNTKKNRIFPGDAADLSAGSRIFVRMNFTAVKEILVME